MPSVALVGFASNSRRLVHNSGADEVWSLNMLHSSPVMRGIFKLNIHRLFEVHPFWLLQTDWYAPTADHWGWLLRVKHHYPVYLVEEHPKIHNGIRYPLEDIQSKLLRNFLRGNPGELKKPISYFTSSFCYMIALAIYEGFDPIEVYGFEMASDTEYVYQKAGGEFWLGLAGGRGHTVVIPEPSTLLRARLYGFEDGQLVPIERIEEYHGFYLSEIDRLALLPDLEPSQQIEILMAQGALRACNDLIGRGQATSRETLEQFRREFDLATKKHTAQLNALNGQAVRASHDGATLEDLQPLIEGAKQNQYHLYTREGAYQLAGKLIQECDLQSPSMQLRNRYKWHAEEEDDEPEPDNDRTLRTEHTAGRPDRVLAGDQQPRSQPPS